MARVDVMKFEPFGERDECHNTDCQRVLELDTEIEKAKVVSSIVPISIENHCWRYRGEGGANLVISLLDRHQIVRFSKSKYPEKNHDGKILEIAFYANNVMRKALGSCYVRPLSVGSVSDADFEHVRLEAQKFRPVERCKKDIMSHSVILSHDCVFLPQDYRRNTIGDTFSIEIKPKQGWHPENSKNDVELCNRCLKQYAMLYQGKINQISRYCPLDLFSGCHLRMKRAIFDLFENPHNRFKIYKNGDLIYTENRGDPDDVDQELVRWLLGEEFKGINDRNFAGLHHLAALVCTSLLANLDPSNVDTSRHSTVPEELIKLTISEVSSSKRHWMSCDTEKNVLPTGSVLERILSLQKQTKLTDSDAKLLCEKLLNNIDDLEKIQEFVLWHPLTIPETSAKSVNDLNQAGLSAAVIADLLELQRFLLSVTAKDVSLLITFRKVDNIDLEHDLDLPVIQLRETFFRVMISVIDLDPKPVHRISSWVRRKEKWLKIYRQHCIKDKRGPESPQFVRQFVSNNGKAKPKDMS